MSKAVNWAIASEILQKLILLGDLEPGREYSQKEIGSLIAKDPDYGLSEPDEKELRDTRAIRAIHDAAAHGLVIATPNKCAIILNNNRETVCQMLILRDTIAMLVGSILAKSKRYGWSRARLVAKLQSMALANLCFRFAGDNAAPSSPHVLVFLPLVLKHLEQICQVDRKDLIKEAEERFKHHNDDDKFLEETAEISKLPPSQIPGELDSFRKQFLRLIDETKFLPMTISPEFTEKLGKLRSMIDKWNPAVTSQQSVIGVKRQARWLFIKHTASVHEGLARLAGFDLVAPLLRTIHIFPGTLWTKLIFEKLPVETYADMMDNSIWELSRVIEALDTCQHLGLSAQDSDRHRVMLAIRNNMIKNLKRWYGTDHMLIEPADVFQFPLRAQPKAFKQFEPAVAAVGAAGTERPQGTQKRKRRK